MPHGLKVKNDGNYLVIDQEYANLALRSKGTSYAGRSNSYTVKVSFPADQAVVAYRATAPIAIFTSINTSGVQTDTIVSNGNANIEYFVFDLPGYATPFNIDYGLRVRNPATGALVFDSRMPYMRVLQDYSGTLPAPGGGPGSSTALTFTGFKPAVIQSQRPFRYDSAPLSAVPPIEWLNTWYTGMFSTNATQAIFYNLVLYYSGDSGTRAGPVRRQLNYNYIIVDVSQL